MRALRVAITSAAAIAGTIYLLHDSTLFSVEVWVPMSFVWLGWYVILDRWAHWNPPLVPAGWFALRHWEADGRIYRRAGVREYSRFVTNGEYDLRNTGKRLITTRADVDAWSYRTRHAETGHLINFVLLLPAIAAAARDGNALVCSALVALTLVFNVWAILLQRYNRSRAEHIRHLRAR